MIITYLGVEFFKVQFGDTILAFNPISKESKFKPTRFFADVALISANHSDFNGVENLSYNGKDPLVISGPGEYETKGVFIKGFQSKTLYGGQEKINTIYIVVLEGITLCFLGAVVDEKLSPEFMEAIEDIDILFLPVGDDGVLDAKKADKLAVTLEPKLIIPMHYREGGVGNSIKTFLKEAGEENIKPVDKLTIKKKDLEGKEGEIVLLNQAE
jgi:L-ascorbate metabolism protein UlaG (beta-lactamase superfamily)